jgi:hypothetical protein
MPGPCGLRVSQSTSLYRARKLFSRVFGIYTHFNCMSFYFQIFLSERKLFVPRYFYLFFDQINSGYHFRNRMLYLQTCIHFQENRNSVYHPPETPPFPLPNSCTSSCHIFCTSPMASALISGVSTDEALLQSLSGACAE